MKHPTAFIRVMLERGGSTGPDAAFRSTSWGMQVRTTIRASELLDTPRLSRLQYRVFALCALSVFADGYDTQAVSYIAPTLSAAWHLPPGAMGPVFAVTLLGSALGSLFLAPLADRWGRKRIIVHAAWVVGVFTAACSFATTLATLELLRFCAGLGLGAAIPNAIALVTEYAPARRRIGLVTLTFCGYPVGAAFGAFVATQLSPRFGWPSVFQFGGATTLLLWPILYRYLAESLTFLSLHDPVGPGTQSIIRRFRPEAPAVTEYRLLADEQPVAERRGMALLFTEGRGAVTVLLGLLAFLTLIDIYLLTSWLPTLIQGMGLTLARASAATATFQLGGILGAITLGWLGDRLGVFYVVSIAYVFGAALIYAMAAHPLPLLLPLTTFGAGFMLIGAQTCNNGIVASIYPTAVRATAIGVNLTIGRIGSIVGPFLTGLLLADNFSAQTVLSLASLPALAAAGGMCLLKPAVRWALVHGSPRGC
jgi:MFS transporter, AAHS family, 4-hydroxybenzoate transporter